MRLAQALPATGALALPGQFERLREHIDPAWIEEALGYAGTASIRRRRLPAEQVIWLVIGMGLYRNEPIEHIVDSLQVALPDRRDTLVAKSAITQARQRLKEDPLAYLFATTAAEWATRSADAHRWRGLALYALDGSTMRVPDSVENRAEFGGQKNAKGESGYPQVRVVAMLAVRSHILSGFRFAPYSVGETTLARDIWREVPEQSLVILDRGFLVKKDLIDLETSGDRHWLCRTKSNTKWAVVAKLGHNDDLVEWDVNETGLSRSWQMRAIHYKRKGHPRATILTSLTDAERYPAEELIALYHERWEVELAYDEIKTHMLEREESIRSRTPAGVRQELWGIAIAYNLVRREMERVAELARVAPTRISFVGALMYFREEMSWLVGRRLAYGTIPGRLANLERNLKRLVLPPRRNRTAPRAVKVKMSNYSRKRPPSGRGAK